MDQHGYAPDSSEGRLMGKYDDAEERAAKQFEDNRDDETPGIGRGALFWLLLGLIVSLGGIVLFIALIPKP